ncbi:MAG: hypothetical protein ACI8R4_003530 [Paracoccaceae bacterium]|jgi:hypothetical protein
MRFVAALVFLLCLPAAIWAQQVALVIGNSKYTSVSELDNPQNDSAAVTKALKAQGFEVITGNNLGRIEMRNTLRQFRGLADKADVALVYYAGHGIEIGGTNYLVPVDARLEDERDAGLEMVEVDLVLRQISGARTLKMVVLDACRNNPFIVKMQRSGSSRGVGQGLGDVQTNQADTLIAYAAAAGAITPDGQAGANSPFTSAFLAAMSGPPTDVRRMLGRVRDQMRLSVPGASPFVYSSLGGGEYVINPRGLRPVAPPVPSAGAEPSGRTSISLDFVRIDRDGSVEDWNDFLIKHEGQSEHPLYAFALEKRQTLQNDAKTAPQDTVAVLTPPTAVPATPPVIAPAFQTPTVTPPPIAPPAFVPPPKQDQRAAARVAPVLTSDQAARSIQTVLKQRACYLGAVDGILGRNSVRGLANFSQTAGVRVALPASRDAAALAAVLQVLDDNPNVQCPRVARTNKVKTRPATATTPKPVAPVVAAPVATKKTKRTGRSPAPEPTLMSDTGDQTKKPKKPVVFSTLPCPKSDELRMRRPECH